jgi:pimeloyl-ACP methyl ester carboxylesterase
MDSMIANTLCVPGARLHYEVRGAGPVLLMINGGPSDADQFVPVAEALAGHYTIVIYDTRGNSRWRPRMRTACSVPSPRNRSTSRQQQRCNGRSRAGPPLSSNRFARWWRTSHRSPNCCLTRQVTERVPRTCTRPTAPASAVVARP